MNIRDDPMVLVVVLVRMHCEVVRRRETSWGVDGDIYVCGRLLLEAIHLVAVILLHVECDTQPETCRCSACKRGANAVRSLYAMTAVGLVLLSAVLGVLLERRGTPAGDDATDTVADGLQQGFLPMCGDDVLSEVAHADEDHDPCHDRLWISQLNRQSGVFLRILRGKALTTLPTTMSTSRMTCWKTVNVLKLTVASPVTVKAE